MVLCFDTNLQEALAALGEHQHCIFSVPQGDSASEGFLKVFGEINWQIVDLLNETYASLLKDKFDLYNWLNYNQDDELSYFLAEAGQNCFNYAEQPKQFHLYLGKNSFILGIEQEKVFDPEKVDAERIKDNQGAAFEFFRNCRSRIFFDDPHRAAWVCIELLLTGSQ